MGGYIGDKFTERLKTDFRVFDGRQALLYVSVGEVETNRHGQIVNTETLVEITDGLCREITSRNQQLVKQLFDEHRSINVSDLIIGDVIIEIPYIQLVNEDGTTITPKDGDRVENIENHSGIEWSVVGHDHSTLLSRWRIIARRL